MFKGLRLFKGGTSISESRVAALDFLFFNIQTKPKYLMLPRKQLGHLAQFRGKVPAIERYRLRLEIILGIQTKVQFQPLIKYTMSILFSISSLLHSAVKINFNS